MNRKTSIAVGACAGLLLSACQTTPTAPPVADQAAEADRIKALDAEWVAAIATKDVAKVVSFYTSDAVFMAPNAPPKTGADLRKDWSDLLALPSVQLTFSPTRIGVSKSGDLAVDIGTYDFSFDGPQGKVQDHGKYEVAWEKQDGAWKVAVDMYSSDVPLPPPPPPPAAPAAPKKPAAKTRPKK